MSDLKFSCPVCKKKVARDAENFPFCSERCRLIDLANWADGTYAVPGEPAGFEEMEESGKPH